jgi:hypothetical protein
MQPGVACQEQVPLLQKLATVQQGQQELTTTLHGLLELATALKHQPAPIPEPSTLHCMACKRVQVFTFYISF